MGVMDFAESSNTRQTQEEPSDEIDVEELTKRVRVKRFLHQYDHRDFTFRGPDPPSIFETNTLDEHWHESWVDKTGEWEPADGIPEMPEKEFVKTDCPCGDVAKMPLMARWTRCNTCSRVLVNREWKDDRVKNPNLKKEEGIDKWT